MMVTRIFGQDSDMPRGYMEGPAAEEAEARLDEVERGRHQEPAAPDRAAVYGATRDNAERHFIGWLGEVDPDELFDSGRAWGLTVVRKRET
jgi:hypothetical protein